MKDKGLSFLKFVLYFTYYLFVCLCVYVFVLQIFVNVSMDVKGQL